MHPTDVRVARVLLPLLALALLFPFPAHAKTPDAQPPAKDSGFVPAGYSLGWSDEFDGDALDASKWDFRTDSKALSTQLPENISVSHGSLHIALKKQESHGKPFTGGGVISKAAFKYGYYESRFEVPAGRGWHTSFWTMKHNPKSDPDREPRDQEIDICEQDSVNLFRYSAGVLDWSPVKHRSFGREHPATPNLAKEFHVWGCEFTAKEVKFYFEGKLTHQTDATKFPHGLQHIWLTSIAYPAGHPEKVVDISKLPADAEFDYVRFYERK